MSLKHQGLLLLLLLFLLSVVIAFDPRVPRYSSSYSPPAEPHEVAKWREDLKAWPKSPTWEHFRNPPAPTEIGAPDFQGAYVFGKYDYRVDVQIRGDRIQYISWGSDDQEGGGAWYTVGEGYRQPNGEWFTIWSCLDLSRSVSNGGAAWFKFDRRRDFIQVDYYHDTLPFGGSPMERGEAVRVDLKPNEEMPANRADVIVLDDWKDRPLEGRVRLHKGVMKARAGKSWTLWGRVVNTRGEGVANAAVKRRAAGKVETLTDSRGFFRLEFDKIEAVTLLAAGKLGYYNGIVSLRKDTAFAAMGPDPSREKVAMATITLREMERRDYMSYEWVSPEYLPNSSPKYTPEKHLNCGNCHRREYDDWKESRHATMAANAWTHAAFEHDARPHAAANGIDRDDCTPCHSPSLASKLHHYHLGGQTLLDARGVDLHGNHCDFCHKIEAVTLPEAPGLNGSIRLLRPNPAGREVPGNVKRVFGPLPDVSFLYMGAGYNPVFEMSELCAGCHEHQLEDRMVTGQGTFSEWKQTRYARPGEDYKECQSCHMPQYTAGKVTQAAGPDGRLMEVNRGGDLSPREIENNGVAIARFATRYRPLSEAHKHSFVGTDDVEFLKTGVDMTVSSRRTETGLHVTVTVSNVGAGHAIPTGHGLKRYIVGVYGKSGGEALEATGGLPSAERTNELRDATTGAIIGRRFKDEGGASWSIPYWRATGEVEDNRLWPDQPRTFKFELPGADSAEVKLVLRRGSPELIRRHGLDLSGGLVAGASLDTIVHSRRVR